MSSAPASVAYSDIGVSDDQCVPSRWPSQCLRIWWCGGEWCPVHHRHTPARRATHMIRYAAPEPACVGTALPLRYALHIHSVQLAGMTVCMHTPLPWETPHTYTVCSLQRNAASERAHLNQHCDTAGGANDLAVGQAVRPITSGFSTSRPIRSTVAMDCTPHSQRSVPADPILNTAATSTAHRPLYIC